MTQTDTTPAFSHLPCLPGHFHYADLSTTDVDGASAFYAGLFGWTYDEVPDAPNRYVVAKIDGRDKAALSGLDQSQRAAGVPPYWLPYLWVTDIDAIVAKLPELGGSVVMEPMDVFELGRMALAQDPTGATFGLWQDAKAGETVVKGEHGSSFWFELHSNDVDAALEFYSQLVGWTYDPQQMGPELTYHLVVPEQTDELQNRAGGIMRQMQQDRDAGIPSTWFVYFNVDDCDAAFATAQELGAKPVMEPHDIPGAGRSCWVTDPQGAYMALMTPDPAQG